MGHIAILLPREELVRQAEEAEEEMLCVSTPGFDLRSIQHEGLYSRIYMS